ncbi:MAG TPA: hypothetical protein VGP84_14290, partial [Gemmatimonadaceae bacterium]|nr:hypothetical protein [Gemmatimonadaceae bacterium]
DIKASHEKTEGLKGEFDRLRSMSGQLTQDYSKLKDLSRETHDETNATVEMVKYVETRLGPLAKLQEMSKTTEERITSLNALAEHVAQKIKALDNQKHTVEHAVVEANRLNDLVRAMEVQISKLNEGSRQTARTEELIDRVEKRAREVGTQLDSGIKARDAFAADLARLEKDRAALTDFVRTYIDRIAVERKEFDAFDQRLKVLQEDQTTLEALQTEPALAERIQRGIKQPRKNARPDQKRKLA